MASAAIIRFDGGTSPDGGEASATHRLAVAVAASQRARTCGRPSAVRGGALRLHRPEVRGAQRSTPRWCVRPRRMV